MKKLGKKLSIYIAAGILSAFCLGWLEAAYSHPGHSDSAFQASVTGPQDVLVVPPDAPGRPAYYATGNLYTFLATSEETGGKFSLFDFLVPPKSSALPHIHSREDEAFYVIEGEVAFQLASPTGIQTKVAPPGSLVFLPKGRPHAWENPGTTPAKMLSLIVPTGFEGFFIDQNQPVIEKSAPTPPPLSPELLAPIAQKYGVRPATPSDFMESNPIPELLDYLVVTPNSNCLSFNAAEGLFTFLATAEETGGQFSLIDVSLLPQSGGGLLRLMQNNQQQAHVFYVLEGEVKFQFDGKTMVAAPGTLIYFPHSKQHAFQNNGTSPAKMLSLLIPSPAPKPATAAS